MTACIRTLSAVSLFCLSMLAWAQTDDDLTLEEWTLPDEEEEAKPVHKEYNNAVWLGYTPARFGQSGADELRMWGIQLGYSRFIQVQDDLPFFVEAGADVSYYGSRNAADLWQLSFRIPVNIMYKCYLSRKYDIAIAPFAGAGVRAIAWAYDRGTHQNLCSDADWKRFQVFWQAGVRFYYSRWYLGASYGRDFPQDDVTPAIHSCGIHLGYSF